MGTGDTGRPGLTADVAVVGAGAAGLATAIFTRRLDPSVRVLLLDGATRPGAKILVSGGSRCNVTNVSVAERDFWGGKPTIVRRVLRALPVPDTIAFFNEIGVMLHEEEHGKLFPDSNRSRDVLEALLGEAARRGAELVAGTRVTAIERSGTAFVLRTADGAIEAARVVLATGGQSLPKSGSDGAGFAMAARLGHTIVPTTPALAPLVLRDSPGAVHRRLSGVSHEVEIVIRVERAIAIKLRGSLLWTHFGISGPVALNASRHWLRATLERRDVQVTLNMMPGAEFDAVDRALDEMAMARPRALAPTALSALLPGAVAEVVLERAAIDRARVLGHVIRTERRRLAHLIAEWPLEVVDSRGYNYAEATAGGVSLDEIDPGTMESRRCPGLFLVGEILDVDGRIGGFNFQWAWASARVAARGLTRS